MPHQGLLRWRDLIRREVAVESVFVVQVGDLERERTNSFCVSLIVFMCQIAPRFNQRDRRWVKRPCQPRLSGTRVR